jgi:hypothetical protein
MSGLLVLSLRPNAWLTTSLVVPFAGSRLSFNLAPRSQGWPGEATAIFWTLSEASQSRHLYLNNLVNVHEAILDEQPAISRANSNDLDVDIDPRSLALFEPGYDHRPWLAFCAH